MPGDLGWLGGAVNVPEGGACSVAGPFWRTTQTRAELGSAMMRMVRWGAVVLAALAVTPALALTEPAPLPRTQAAVDNATCGGRDMMADLTPDQRAKIDAAVAATPYAHGIRWTATKGDARIEIVGTYHLEDERLNATVQSLVPVLHQAAALLVEAGPAEEKALRDAIAADPSLIVDGKGPTLPERLGTADWDRLSAALKRRDILPVMASRFRPEFVATLLSVTPCEKRRLQADGAQGGVDHRLIAAAQHSGVPILPLEPWQTALAVFDGVDEPDDLNMMRQLLFSEEGEEDYAGTVREAYLRGDIWAVWELLRQGQIVPGLDEATLDRLNALIEDRLMTRRNAQWIEPLTEAAERAAADGKPVLAAFGALHLPGENGVLRLLERDGWTITAAQPG